MAVATLHRQDLSGYWLVSSKSPLFMAPCRDPLPMGPMGSAFECRLAN